MLIRLQNLVLSAIVYAALTPSLAAKETATTGMFGNTQQEDDTTYHTSVDQWPEPIRGMEVMQLRVIYPELALRAGIEGKVLVEAFINETGKVVKTQILEGIGGGCDEAAAAAIWRTGFKPGRHNGVPVKTRIVIPVRFKLHTSPESPKVDPAKITKPSVFVVQGPKDLGTNLSYPRPAVEAKIEGTVLATVLLDEQGKVRNVSLLQGIGGKCDEEVLRELVTYDFTKDPEYRSVPGGKTVTVVVRFVLPKK